MHTAAAVTKLPPWRRLLAKPAAPACRAHACAADRACAGVSAPAAPQGASEAMRWGAGAGAGDGPVVAQAVPAHAARTRLTVAPSSTRARGEKRERCIGQSLLASGRTQVQRAG